MPATDLVTVEQQCAAYAPRLSPEQFFSHVTAARLWKLPVPRIFTANEPIHIATPHRDKRVRSRGVTGHRLCPPTHRVVRLGRLRVSDAVSTWLQLASILSRDDLVAVGDALVLEPVYPDRSAPARRPYARPDELRRRVAAFRGPGKRRLCEAVELVRLGCESAKETELRLLLCRGGLPEPRVNMPLLDTAAHFVPRGDLVYHRYRVIVEYDGEQHRTDSAQYERDQQRAAELRAAGYNLITVRKAGLTVAGRQRTLAEVRRALSAAGWHPGIPPPAQ